MKVGAVITAGEGWATFQFLKLAAGNSWEVLANVTEGVIFLVKIFRSINELRGISKNYRSLIPKIVGSIH